MNKEERLKEEKERNEDREREREEERNEDRERKKMWIPFLGFMVALSRLRVFSTRLESLLCHSGETWK